MKHLTLAPEALQDEQAPESRWSSAEDLLLTLAQALEGPRYDLLHVVCPQAGVKPARHSGEVNVSRFYV
jgi:hypothetical protein